MRIDEVANRHVLTVPAVDRHGVLAAHVLAHRIDPLLLAGRVVVALYAEVLRVLLLSVELPIDLLRLELDVVREFRASTDDQRITST